MHKILLVLLFLVVFFFPKSEVFAQEACSRMVCPTGTIQVSFTECAPGLAAARVPPTTPICPAGKIPSRPNDIPNCRCDPSAAGAPAGAAPAAPGAPAAPAAAGTPTSGGGQRCDPTANTFTTSGTGIMTAIGCIPTEPKALVEGLLKFAVLAAGGIAFLLMILGALGMITAEGNPEAIKNSQERFYSAIIGLLLIIFSVLLMQVIGVDILGLPGFDR